MTFAAYLCTWPHSNVQCSCLIKSDITAFTNDKPKNLCVGVSDRTNSEYWVRKPQPVQLKRRASKILKSTTGNLISCLMVMVGGCRGTRYTVRQWLGTAIALDLTPTPKFMSIKFTVTVSSNSFPFHLYYIIGRKTISCSCGRNM